MRERITQLLAASPGTVEYAEVERVHNAMYTSCYWGHIPSEIWRKFAAFAIAYAESKNKK